MNGNNPEPTMSINALENMHKLLFKALRQREQEIIRYLAILGPALGGFIFMLYKKIDEPIIFTVGTLGAMLLLLFGIIIELLKINFGLKNVATLC
ncbi:MAG: hypothetical protein IIC74_07750 [Bacteroidetes bacterium]|nr:hypothetical protein [Bacteroidota bacterium]